MSTEPALLSYKDLAQELLEQAILDFLIAPATRLLILVQTQPQPDETFSEDQKKRSIFFYLSRIIKREGITGLWKGNLLETLKNSVFIIGNTIFLKLYEPFFLPADPNRSDVQTSIREFLLASAVEFSTLLIQHPLRVIRIKLSNFSEATGAESSQRFKGLRRIGNCAKKIWEEEGLKGFYKGFSLSLVHKFASMLLISGGRAWVDKMHPNLETQKHKRRLLLDLMTAGSPVGMLAAYLSRSNSIKRIKKDIQKTILRVGISSASMLLLYPIGVIQARIIAEDEEIIKYRADPVQVVKKVWEKEGLRGLYRGLFVSMCATLGSMMMYPVARVISKKIISTGDETNQVKSQPQEEGRRRRRKRDELKKYVGDKKDKIKEKQKQYTEKLKKVREENGQVRSNDNQRTSA